MSFALQKSTAESIQISENIYLQSIFQNLTKLVDKLQTVYFHKVQT